MGAYGQMENREIRNIGFYYQDAAPVGEEEEAPVEEDQAEGEVDGGETETDPVVEDGGVDETEGQDEVETPPEEQP